MGSDLGILEAESEKRALGTLRAPATPPNGDIVSVVVSRPGLPPSDLPAEGRNNHNPSSQVEETMLLNHNSVTKC